MSTEQVTSEGFTEKEKEAAEKIAAELDALTGREDLHYLFFMADESKSEIRVFLHGRISQNIATNLGLRLLRVEEVLN